ncbi:hypothetical protein ACFWY6_35860 [Streptomyces sp. NPDC059037]|uniref:hypothetical protein n=1 Tax=Streptomyces sp. NPDC059037 TaxID=3346710 RepID=UPI00368DBC1E
MAAPDDTSHAAESRGCLVKGDDAVWASCHGKVPLGKAGRERRAGGLGQPVEP